MGRAQKPALTRRQENTYRSILCGQYVDVSNYFRRPALSQNDALARSAYRFAREWSGRNINIRALQKVVDNFGSAETAYMFARDIEGAKISRLQAVVLEYGTADQKREFARKVKGSNTALLESMAIIQDVMDD